MECYHSSEFTNKASIGNGVVGSLESQLPFSDDEIPRFMKSYD